MNDVENISKYYQPLKLGDFGENFGEYWKAINNNLEASVSRLPKLWELFNKLAELFDMGLDLCSTNLNKDKVMPYVFFKLSNRFFIASIKPLFSTQLPEALNTVRMSIESAVIAKKMLDDSKYIIIWNNQNENEEAEKEYKKYFVHNKRKNLFPEEDVIVNQLYNYWQDYSHLATHINKDGMDFWLNIRDSENGMVYNIKYAEDNESYIVSSLISALRCLTLIENLFYKEFNDRLKFDIELERLRDEFSKEHDIERKKIISNFKARKLNENES